MTAKMAYNHQFSGGKNLTFNGDAEVTPDLHYRMSKKIAQLTKVIYSLKTKTDEHDTNVEDMKTQHQGQMQQLLQETKVKLEGYQTKVCSELQLQRKIEELECKLLEFEHHKQKALNEFQDYRAHAEQREIALKTEQSDRVLRISQDVLSVKRDFEGQIQQFSESMNKAELAHINKMNELEQRHRLEMEKLHEAYGSRECDVDSKIAALNEVHMREKENMKKEIAVQRYEYEQNIEDYEIKLNKAQSFYENELAAINLTYDSQASSDLEKLKKNRDVMKQDFNHEKRELTGRIETLLSQIVMAEQETDDCRSEIKLMKITVRGHEENVSSLNQQLVDLRNSLNNVTSKLDKSENELSTTKQRCVHQKQELSSKSHLLDSLELKDRNQMTTISGLNDQVTQFQERLNHLEGENKKLFGSSLSTKEKNSWQLEELRKALEDLTKKKKVPTATLR